MLSTYASYQLITRDLTRSLAMKSAEPQVALETQNFLKKIGGITTIEEFLRDTRVFNYAMKAFGLEDLAHAKGMMRKVLVEGIADPKSFANRLNDDRFLEFARVFDFATEGTATTAKAAARQGVVDRYVRQSLEVSAGTENEGVRLALYFQRTAPQVKSVYGLLSDPALWKVMQTVFGFPSEMGTAQIDKQAAAVTKRFDIAKLQDPKEVSRLIQRFTASWDVQSGAAASPVLTLFAPQQPAIGLDLLMSLQNLKRGGF